METDYLSLILPDSFDLVPVKFGKNSKSSLLYEPIIYYFRIFYNST